MDGTVRHVVDEALAQAAYDYLDLYGDGSDLERRGPALIRLGTIIVALEYLMEAT